MKAEKPVRPSMPDENKPQELKIQTRQGTQNTILVRWDIHQETHETEDDTQDMWVYEEEKVHWTYNGDQAQLEQFLQNHRKEIVLKAKGKADKLEPSDKENLSYPTFQADSTYKGTITEIDGANKKVKVEKTVGDRTISAWCYADYTLLLAYQNDDLAVGDMVIVSFVDEDLDLPYAHGLPLGV